jgi:negative regulator of sigma E activity
VTFAFAPHTRAQDARQLDRAASAARTLSYSGTIVYQRGAEVDRAHRAHQRRGRRLEKLVNPTVPRAR